MTRITRLRAHAVLFVALSGAAVPACQHFDGDTTQKSRTEATLRPGVGVAPAATPHDPRLPLPPRARG